MQTGYWECMIGRAVLDDTSFDIHAYMTDRAINAAKHSLFGRIGVYAVTAIDGPFDFRMSPGDLKSEECLFRMTVTVELVEPPEYDYEVLSIDPDIPKKKVWVDIQIARELLNDPAFNVVQHIKSQSISAAKVSTFGRIGAYAVTTIDGPWSFRIQPGDLPDHIRMYHAEVSMAFVDPPEFDTEHYSQEGNSHASQGH